MSSHDQYVLSQLRNLLNSHTSTPINTAAAAAHHLANLLNSVNSDPHRTAYQPKEQELEEMQRMREEISRQELNEIIADLGLELFEESLEDNPAPGYESRRDLLRELIALREHGDYMEVTEMERQRQEQRRLLELDIDLKLELWERSLLCTSTGEKE